MLLAFLLFYFPSVLTLFSRSGEPKAWMVTGMVMATFYTVVFCINYFWLVPWMLRHSDKRSLYFIANGVIILLACALIALWFEHTGGLPMHKGHRHEALSPLQLVLGYFRFIIRDGIMMVLSATLAYALRLSETRERLRRRDLELSAEKRQIEIQSLKAQLNPHFLFNSLNNIYALIGFAPERAQTALHELSSMLRFMIYDSGSSTVELSKEMQFISDYTALMKLRLNSNIEVSCDVIQYPPAGICIAPLLFLTLVENAFKHVAPLPSGKGFIHITISLLPGSERASKAPASAPTITGTVSNTFVNPSRDNGNGATASVANEEAPSGVGLENVKRQLSLLYPDSHSLTIENDGNIFTVTLSITPTQANQ